MLSMTLHKSLQMRSPLDVEKTHFDFRPPPLEHTRHGGNDFSCLRAQVDDLGPIALLLDKLRRTDPDPLLKIDISPAHLYDTRSAHGGEHCDFTCSRSGT